MFKTKRIPEINTVNAFQVCGRGIKHNGKLYDTGYERTAISVALAWILRPERVVFTGGNSWRQRYAKLSLPSEGGTMLEYAQTACGPLPPGVEFLAETTSTSTVDNMTNSKAILALKRGERLLTISDYVHFIANRVEYIAGLVYPDVEHSFIRIPREYTSTDVREEYFTTAATHLAMLGVEKGNVDAIHARQERLVSANESLRRLVGQFVPRPEEIESNTPTYSPAQEASYMAVPSFRLMNPQQMGAFLLGATS